MNIALYKTTDDNRRVVKTLSGMLAKSVELKQPTDILNPVLILTGANIIDYNYVHIPTFNRYYYITDIIGLNDKRVEIHCKVDVLMSYQSQIRALSPLVERQENKKNKMIVDTEYILQSNENFVCKQFGNSVNADSNYAIYLTTNGGAS